MYLKELKERVEHDEYVVDPHRVAEALLRRAAARRSSASATRCASITYVSCSTRSLSSFRYISKSRSSTPCGLGIGS